MVLARVRRDEDMIVLSAVRQLPKWAPASISSLDVLIKAGSCNRRQCAAGVFCRDPQATPATRRYVVARYACREKGGEWGPSRRCRSADRPYDGLTASPKRSFMDISSYP